VILVDTSIWIDHFRAGDSALAPLLEDGRVLGHPWVIGEIALGRISRRQEILTLLAALPQAAVATPPELLALIENRELYGLGIGYVDAQLLAATLLTPDTKLWTHDKHLAQAASALRCAAEVRGGAVTENGPW
jgi:predicted nucleic acid-binding protein